jgi:hypothetical protein
MFAAPPPYLPPPTVVESPANATAGALDLASVSLGQLDTQFTLTVKTHAAFKATDFTPARTICLVLSTGARLCVVNTPDGLALQNAAKPVPAFVEQPDDETLTATFTPAAAEVPLKAFTWSVESHWDTAADRAPQTGEEPGKAVLLAQPKCFGAAARDPWKPCTNPLLKKVITPTPSQATLIPNAPCTPTQRASLVSPCVFGVDAPQAKADFAVVGDSHAEHWRAAMEVVAQAKSWRGLSITLTSCPFSTATAQLQTPALTARCGRWSKAVRAWFADHPEVHTIFVSANVDSHFDGDAVSGFRAAWRGLPKSVRRIYVIRDTPKIVRPQAGCVNELIRAKKSVGFQCAQSRSSNLRPDPEATAARSGAESRVKLLDFSDLFCSPTLCPAVIGGVLVRKDGDHMTRAFAATMGPFVVRAIG